MQLYDTYLDIYTAGIIPYWRISDPPPVGVCKRTRGGMPGEGRGTPGDVTSLPFPLGGMLGEFPGVHQPWGNEQECNTLPLYSHKVVVASWFSTLTLTL